MHTRTQARVNARKHTHTYTHTHPHDALGRGTPLGSYIGARGVVLQSVRRHRKGLRDVVGPSVELRGGRVRVHVDIVR